MTVVNAQIPQIAPLRRAATVVSNAVSGILAAPKSKDRYQGNAAAPKADPLANYETRPGSTNADFLAAGWQETTPEQREIADTKAKLATATSTLAWPDMLQLGDRLKLLMAQAKFKDGGADRAELLGQMKDIDQKIQACGAGDVDQLLNLHQSMAIRELQLNAFGEPHSKDQQARLNRIGYLEHQFWAAPNSLEKAKIQACINVETAEFKRMDGPVSPAQKRLMNEIRAITNQMGPVSSASQQMQLDLKLQARMSRLESLDGPVSPARARILNAMDKVAHDAASATTAGEVQRVLIAMQELRTSFEKTP
ncbi:MAG: hypothetical protein JWM80_614 [Cyanobacteria bacterium RYN_339]|nr:hypothetical protein [Cyanobacteria bacterium RYN_339]